MNREETIAILGAGESGVAAALLAQKQGYEVFVSDNAPVADAFKEELMANGIAFEENGHTEYKIKACAEAVKSPGIPDDATVIQTLRANQIPVIGEIEFAARYSRGYIIAITGTNGKTTTTLLTWYILQQAGLKAACAGNVGNAFSRKVLEGGYDYYVLEISSFQLDDVVDFKVDAGVILNITPDHLNRYGGKIENYVAAKFRMLQSVKSRGYFIYNAEDPLILEALANHAPKSVSALGFALNKKGFEGAFGNEDYVEVQYEDIVTSINVSQCSLRGKHNLQNIMAAALIAVMLGISHTKIEKALESFKNEAHRMEWVAETAGVHYINDSKATNVNAAWYALDAMHKPVVWIAGGTDKGNDYTELYELVQNKVKALIALGLDNTGLKKAFADKVPRLIEAESMQDAVQKANEIAISGDVVLLSPCCASFDLFKNYKDRGDHFKSDVLALKTHTKNV